MKLRILHLDPQCMNPMELNEHLLPFGYITDHTASVTEAVSAVLNKQYDVVICEMDLRTIAGADLIRGLKGLNPSLVVVVLSGSGNHEDMQAAFSAGASEYFVKSLNAFQIGPFLFQLEAAMNKADTSKL
jgi:CheY-like chemotaxis protein